MLSQTIRLSISLAKAGFKLRNEGSYLGILWYLINPLLLFSLLLGVFSDRLGRNIDNYPLYLLLGIIMFNFFQQVTKDAIKAVQGNNILIKSINFPRDALVGSSVIKFLLSHSFEVVVFASVMIVFGVPLSGIIFYPIIMMLFSIFVYGISLGLFSIAFYFADLENIWVFVARLLWFATPIFYAIGGQQRLLIINLLNPIYYFITIARGIILYRQKPEMWVLMGMLFFTLLSITTGQLLFTKMKGKFAEMI